MAVSIQEERGAVARNMICDREVLGLMRTDIEWLGLLIRLNWSLSHPALHS